MVEFRRGGGVARIFLNRPRKVNALDSALLEALAAAIGQVGEGDRVAVLGGHGGVFCSGADVNAQRSAAAWRLRPPATCAWRRAARMVLPGEEAVCDEDELDATIERLIELPLMADPAALRMQKALRQAWGTPVASPTI